MKYKDKMYYSNPLTDEVIDFGIKAKIIDKNYKYIHKNPFYRFSQFFMYTFIAQPMVWFYVKGKNIKIKNRKLLKKCKKGGYFIFGNHTQQLMDGFLPTYACWPKKPYLICNADNVSMPFLGKITPMWGAIPLPDTIDATRNFNKKIEYTLNKNCPIVIYPERHMWPYYTKIRPYDEKSFRYPAKYNKPIYTFTTVYKRKKEGKPPRIIVYVDGPFYADNNLDTSAKRKQLRDWAYTTMCNRAKESDYEYLTYIQKEPEQDNQHTT